MNKKHVGMIAGTALAFLIFLLTGPLDIFTHGFFPDEIDVAQIAEMDRLGTISVNDDNCVIVFSPKERHFAGVELYFVNHVPEDGGILTMSVYDFSGRQVDSVDIELEKVRDSAWYKVYTNAALKRREEYTIRFSVSDGGNVPSLMLVDKDYLPGESLSGNILVSYAYSQSTFSYQEKVIFGMVLLSLWGLAMYYFMSNEKYRKYLKIAISFTILTAGLTWNYMYNSMDNQNKDFEGFQSDSEALVTGRIYAERDGIDFQIESERGYGLGWYCNLKGTLINEELNYITDGNWLDGYNRWESSIIVNSNDVTREIAVVGNCIQFENGEEYQITETVDDGNNIVITLNAERALSQARNGSLDDASFFDDGHQPIAKSMLTAYGSQYGLQGKVFRHMARYMDEEDALANLNLICALATAAIFVLIVMLVSIKFNPVFAGCFYFTFLLSPWIVNFARNLYWVEFTWFIPMAVGLLCAIKIQSRKWRIGCYIAAFIAVTGKCLCGYEYISVIMMGLVSFLVIDLLLAVIKKDKGRSRLIFRTTFVISIITLLAFMTAICIHAPLRGGNIIEGIKRIIAEDVLRRTNGANLNDFDRTYWPSMNASVWEVYSQYFHFSTEIVTGIAGNLFPLLCVIPLMVFVYDYRKHKTDFQSVIMYVFFFLTTISWFCLAKSHSYVHPHMNYVLWYFGFVQTCFYIIVSRIISMMSGGKEK